jgi:hypothetical protein
MEQAEEEEPQELRIRQANEEIVRDLPQNTQQHQRECKYCDDTGHFDSECPIPHAHCYRKDARGCAVPKDHPQFVNDLGGCPYMGKPASITRNYPKWPCKYCQQLGHFYFNCEAPHRRCRREGQGTCMVPHRHKGYSSHLDHCPYQGISNPDSPDLRKEKSKRETRKRAKGERII